MALSLPFPDIIVGVACNSLCATTITILDEVVGVVPFDAGNAGALTTDACVVEVLTTAAEVVVALVAVVLARAAAKLTEETPAPPPPPPSSSPTPAPAASAPATFGWAWMVAAVVEVVVVKAAADAASLPVSVVDALGTAVHRWPFIEVMENPAGRFAFVGMMKGKATAAL
jgi:hypothetical protein